MSQIGGIRRNVNKRHLIILIIRCLAYTYRTKITYLLSDMNQPRRFIAYLADITDNLLRMLTCRDSDCNRPLLLITPTIW